VATPQYDERALNKIMINLKQFNILVTPKSYGANNIALKTDLENYVCEVTYNQLGRPYSESDLIKVIPYVDGYIAGLDEINERVINAATRLKVISRYGVGIDRVDIEAATAKGIIVTNTPGTNSASVAELTVGLILSILRKICELNNLTKSGKWVFMNTSSIKNKNVGLIGLGAIGKETAKRLQAFDCNILAYDPFVNEAESVESKVEMCSLDTLISKSDVISLHIPSTPATYKFINQSFISKMKRGAVLINTARGELMDNDAIVQALESGQLGGLALDAYNREPPDFNDPIFTFNQVIATPHTGAHTDDATNSMGRMALENCMTALRGELPDHIVNPEVLKKVMKGN